MNKTKTEEEKINSINFLDIDDKSLKQNGPKEDDKSKQNNVSNQQSKENNSKLNNTYNPKGIYY